MTKAKTNADASAEPAAEPVPTHVKAGDTPIDILRRLSVIDEMTGEKIIKVVEADAAVKRVYRFAVEGDALIREDNRFKMIVEERAIRFEWAPDGEDGSF